MNDIGHASSHKLPAAKHGKKITILSIDGGGVRGIIPGVILNALEMELQVKDGPEARLADYFDVIAGTSTGGLLTALLTAPDEHGRPFLAAKDITEFYTKECPHIFPHRNDPITAPLMNAFTAVFGPRYDGKHLHQLIKKKLRTKTPASTGTQYDCPNIRLQDTLTNVVIPAFDIKTLEPVIFSNLEILKSPRLNCNLSDICIGTSAAPTFLPAHYFKNEHFHGEKPEDNEFNLIDGGVCANNPTLIALSIVTKAIFNEKNKEDKHTYFPKDMEGNYGQFLVLSLGTGTPCPKDERKYNAKMASKWGIFGWLLHHFSTPLVDVFTQGSADLVDFHLCPVFQALALQSKDKDISQALALQTPSKDKSETINLRTQDNTLKGEVASTDVSSGTNLQNLVDAGKSLLTKPVVRVDMETGKPKPQMETTNETALTLQTPSNDKSETIYNYLRIQDNTLKGEVASTDVSSGTNLQNLVDAGKSLLTKPVMRVDMETGKPKPQVGTTNETALKEFALKLLNERQIRKTNYELSLKKAEPSK